MRVVGRVFEYVKLRLHPKKTKALDLGWGKDGFDFLDCYLRKQMSLARLLGMALLFTLASATAHAFESTPVLQGNSSPALVPMLLGTMCAALWLSHRRR